MLTVLILFGPAAIPVAAGVRALAGAFPSAQPPSRNRLMLGIGILLLPFLWFLTLASYPGYGNVIGSVYVFLAIPVFGVLGGLVLIVKPPMARRLAGALLAIGYPLLLIAIVMLATLLQFGIFARNPHWH